MHGVEEPITALEDTARRMSDDLSQLVLRKSPHLLHRAYFLFYDRSFAQLRRVPQAFPRDVHRSHAFGGAVHPRSLKGFRRRRYDVRALELAKPRVPHAHIPVHGRCAEERIETGVLKLLLQRPPTKELRFGVR